MTQSLEKYRSNIGEFLTKFLKAKETELSRVNRWGRDLMKRLSEFSPRGKMVRGSIAILSYRMYKRGFPQSIVKIASALEMIHSSLLIHDDIMDKDSIRRGKKSIYNQYRELGSKEHTYDPYHFGTSLGICAGDIGFYLAYEILATVQLNPVLKESLFALWSKELVSVALAQMQDMYFGSTQRLVGEEEVIKLYLYKTARYTFSLPLATGALVAGEDRKTLNMLEELGEYLGTIYQIRDDELSLFGKEQEIGKPLGTDLREGKKTLHFLYLTEMLRDGDKRALADIVKKATISPFDLREIRQLIEKSGVIERIRNKAHEMKLEAEKLIQALSIGGKSRTILLEILHYTYERKR